MILLSAQVILTCRPPLQALLDQIFGTLARTQACMLSVLFTYHRYNKTPMKEKKKLDTSVFDTDTGISYSYAYT